MAYDKQKVINIALAEEGYREKNSASQLDDKAANAGSKNYTKYARDLDALGFYNGRKQGAAWCDVFVDWCFVQAYGKAAALAMTFQPTKAANNCGAGCRYSRNYYKAKGQLFNDPQPGDQIFFWSADRSQVQHTGLVYKVTSSQVFTIEGNASDGVRRKVYSRAYSRLAGFGRPAYGTAQPAQQTPSAAATGQQSQYQTYTVKRGDCLWNIAARFLGSGVRYKEIVQLNGLKSSLIRTGQVLKIPKR